eukprot:m51a1_g817 hypothetical protein (348) ;mRNA; r:692639-693726
MQQGSQAEEHLSEFLEAVQGGDAPRVASLVSAAPWLLHARDPRGMCGLCWSAYFDEPSPLRPPRRPSGGRDARGATALHHAAVNGSVRVLRVFAECPDAPWLAANEWGETCLHVAAAAGLARSHPAVATMLERAPELALARDKWGRAAFESGAAAVPAAAPQSAAGLKGDLEAEFMRMREQWSRRARRVDVVERGMFADRGSGAAPAVPAAAKSPACAAQRRALSKMVEYPGDPAAVAEALARPGDVDPCGRDMFGLSALHKFSSWDKADLVAMLLPHLSPDDVNARGGDGRQTALEMAVEMRAMRAVRVLLESAAVSAASVEALRAAASTSGDGELLAALEVAPRT